MIGRDGDLPWRLPSDLRRFKEITLGGTVVMGRRTYESLPDAFRPLPGRRNIVLSSRDVDYAGAEVVHSLDAAFAAAGGECFVIGGGVTYAEALPRARRAYVTLVDADVDGDTFFPELPASEWHLVSESEPIAENGHEFTFRVLERV